MLALLLVIAASEAARTSLLRGDVVCTTEVMKCPNGAIVDRDPNNNCNFRPCTEAGKQFSLERRHISNKIYSLTAPVTGKFHNGKVTGDFSPIHFLERDDLLMVRGRLTAALTRSNEIIGRVNTLVTWQVLTNDLDILNRRRLLQVDLPIVDNLLQQNTTGSPNSTSSPTSSPTSAPRGACRVLHLTLEGPTDLDLLGLLVHLDPVLLDITAQPGGGLLGNLLCSVSGLLDNLIGGLGNLSNLLGSLGNLGQGADLLNSILGLLNLANLPASNLAGLESIVTLLNSVTGLLNGLGR